MNGNVNTQTSDKFTRIQQPGLIWLGRGVWLLMFVFSVALLAFNLVRFYDFAQVVCTDTECPPFALTPLLVEQMAAFGLPSSFWGAHIVILDILLAVVFMGVGTLILLWRSDDWLSLLVSGMLVMLTINASLSNSYYNEENLLVLRLAQLHTVISIYTLLKFVSVFPDGRYINRWGRVIVYGGTAWEVLRRTVITAPITASDTLLFTYLLATLFFAGLGILGQFHRYRKFSTPLQRQQTKWLVLSGALCFIGVTTSASVYFVVEPVLASYTNTLLLNLGLRGLYYLSLCILPVGLGLAVFRYKVWEADLAIHRSVVFASLSFILIALFVFSFFLLDGLLRALFGQDVEIIASVIAIGMAAVAFMPISLRVRHFIDEEIYGFRIDLEEMAQQQRRRAEVISTGEEGFFTGQQISHYLVGSLVGNGGMGQVYQAVDTRTNQVVAVKVLAQTLLTDAESTARFEQEAVFASQLDHPTLVPVLDAGVDKSIHYIVMPFIEGRDLEAAIKMGCVYSPSEIMPVLNDVVSGLDYLHERGLVHRDVKPGNIIVSPDGHAFLTDFGLAKAVESSSHLTSNGVVGTLAYVAPEQITSAHKVDHRSDIYALGVTCYKLVTGKQPFDGNVGQLVFAHLNQPPPDPRLHRPDLPLHISVAILQAMSKDPDDRFVSAKAFLAAWDMD